LSSFVRSRGLQSGAGLARILPVWDEVVGSDIARHAQPVLLRANELVCEVDDAAWATQLRLLGQQILDQLSAAIGERVAEQLSVRVARRPRGS
jgi:predicted nucleic acid-binding Zn ribbon protein